MKSYCAALAVLGGLLVAGGARAGEDKDLPQRQDKDKPAAAKPAEQKSMDVDAFIKRFDKNGDGCLQKNELPPALRACFEDMDADKDGKLSKDELSKHMNLLTKWHAMTERRRERLVAVGNLLAQSARGDDPGLKVLQVAYDVLKRIDADQDGKIDRAELDAAQKKLAEMRADALLERQGAKDGKLKKEECFGRARRHFDHWDLNHDGVIDRDELIKVFRGDAPVARADKKVGERKALREKAQTRREKIKERREKVKEKPEK